MRHLIHNRGLVYPMTSTINPPDIWPKEYGGYLFVSGFYQTFDIWPKSGYPAILPVYGYVAGWLSKQQGN